MMLKAVVVFDFGHTIMEMFSKLTKKGLRSQNLPIKLQRHLDLPGKRTTGALNLSETSASHSRVRPAEGRMVESIEELGPKL